MKKFFTLALLAAFALMGCKKDKGANLPDYSEYDKNAAKITFSEVSGVYYGTQFSSDDSFCYGVVLSNHANILDLMSGYTVMEAGSEYLYINLYSAKAAKDPVNFKVPNGVYTFDSEDSALAGTVCGNNTILMMLNRDNIFFSKGSVTVTNDQIVARLTSESGADYLFVGANKAVDNSNAYGVGATPGISSTLTDDLHIPYDGEILELYAVKMGDALCVGKSCWVLYANDWDSGDQLFTTILADADAEFPVGTHTISNDITKNGALSGYADGWGYYQGTWWSRYSEVGEVGSAPIVGGTVTIAHNADETSTVTLDLKDNLGNAITGSCTSNLMIIEMPEPSSTISSAGGFNLGKALLDLRNKVHTAASKR